MAAMEKIRIRLKSYDHTLVDQAAAKIVDTAKRNGATVSGPIPLPTEKEIVTILRAVHKDKDSREQFEMRTHKRVIDVIKPSQKAVDAITGLELPAGVEIEVKICSERFLLCVGHVGMRACQPITQQEDMKHEKRYHRKEIGDDADL